MYALIHNSQLLLGPIGWNYRMINSDLEDELELDYRVTKDSWQSVPISVNEETHILPAKQIIPPYDSNYQYVGNFTWEKECSDLTNSTSTDSSSFVESIEITDISVESTGTFTCTIPNLGVGVASKIQIKDLQFDTSNGVVSLEDRTYLVSSINEDGSFVLYPKRYDIQEYLDLFNASPVYSGNAYVVNEIKVSAVVFTYPIHDKSLETVKIEYSANVKPERQRREDSYITVTVDNTEISVSTSRENRLMLATKLMGNEGPYNFKFAEGIWLEVTKENLEYIIQQIDAYVQEQYDWEFNKLAEIDACTTPEEVYNVVLREVSEPSLIPGV